MLNNTRMLLNAEQHRGIAARYRKPDPDLSEEMRAWSLRLAAAFETLAKTAEKRALESAKRGEPDETEFAAIWP